VLDLAIKGNGAGLLLWFFLTFAHGAIIRGVQKLS